MGALLSVTVRVGGSEARELKATLMNFGRRPSR